MHTSPINPADLARSVWAVPPLAVTEDGKLNNSANQALAAHIEAGGVSTILWGGNANIYAMTDAEYASLAAAIPDWVSPETWALPSAGPDYGKLRAHASALRGRGYPAAMLLPYSGPGDALGTEAAIRAFVDSAELPVILYVKREHYLPPDRIASLLEDQIVIGIKYAVETGDFTSDAYLDALLAELPTERLVSGIGELAAIPHLSTFCLASFTAGAVCIAPRRAMAILNALQSGDVAAASALAAAIQPLEDLRIAHGPIPVLHAALTASGIAEMGPLGPHFGPLPEAARAALPAAVEALRDSDAGIPLAA